jgi:hypothetical protein
MFKNKIPKEHELILFCARLEISDSSRQNIENLLKSPLDWDKIFNTAHYQKILSFVYYTLDKLDLQHVPYVTLKKMRNYYYSNLHKNLLVEKEIARVLEAAYKEGVDLIPLKGFSLIQTLYTNPALRTMVDIDILVKKHDIQKIQSVFDKLSYDENIDEQLPKKRGRINKHELIISKQLSAGQIIIIEVHSAIAFPRPYKLNIPDLWISVEKKEIHNQKMLCLSKENTFLSLVLHLRMHTRLLNLKFIVDIAEMLNINGGQLDWNYIRETVNNNHIRTSVYLSLYLAKELLDANILPEIMNKFAPNSIKKTLIRLTVNKYNFFSLTNKRGTFLRFLLFDKFIDVVFYLWRVSFCERFIGMKID